MDNSEKTMTKSVGAIEYINDSSKPLAESLAQYLKYVLELEGSDPNIKILLVEIDHNWEVGAFYDRIKNFSESDNVKGILFFTLEPFPRGDSPDSSFNKSRMLREFFENSFNAVTANHENLLTQLYCLIYKIVKSDFEDMGAAVQSFQAAIKQLNYLLNHITMICNSESGIPKANFEIGLDSLSTSYPFGGIHSKGGHNYFREFLEELKKFNLDNEIKEKAMKIFELGMNFDLASIVANNPLQYEDGFKILVIDDNIDNIENDFKKIMPFLPKGSSIYITRKNEWKKFLKYEEPFWENMCKGKAQLSMKELTNEEDTDEKTIPFDFIVVDLLMGDYNEGNQIINNLENSRNVFNRSCEEKVEKTYFDIIVLSLSEEAHDISRALNEGGLCYVPKKRIYMLPAIVVKLEKSRRIIKRRADQFNSMQKSQNFGKLYRLPEIIKRKLQNEPFLDLLFPDNFEGEIKNVVENLNLHLKGRTKEWVKNMPKADLHCHMGGSIDADTAFFLSLNMLARYCSNEQSKSTYCEEILPNIAEQYFDFISLIIEKISNLKDLFRFVKIILDIIHKFDINNPNIGNTKKKNIINYLKELAAPDNKLAHSYDIILNRFKQFFEDFLGQIEGYLKYSDLKKRDPNKLIAEKEFFLMLKYLNEKIQKNISLPDPVNIFNVVIGIIEGKTVNDIDMFWKKLDQPINLLQPDSGKKFPIDADILKSMPKNRELFEQIKSKLESKKKIKELRDKIRVESLLSHFISAKQRQTRSLEEYLGGNEFMGSEQLQYKENILAAVYSIIEKNIEDNVRYLEIRLSPDGYIKMGLTMQEVIQTLLLGTDLITFHFYSQGKFIRVNYIFSIKRHKAPQEAALEISAAIVNRQREIKCYRDLTSKEPNQNNLDIHKYEWKPSKVMGIDLSGLEKGNPAQNFISDFFPLFKTSSFITIHAGEEDTAQSIWAAVYLLHANRIGHGLTLHEIPELKEMFKNLQICIEMNPISNILTNPNIEDRYPFYNYFIDGLNITINTDDPAVSDSTLSDEFVKVGELFQKHRKNHEHSWISKWEILRIIKNGFSSAFLDREEKRQLLRSVEEEIYQKIIKEYDC